MLKRNQISRFAFTFVIISSLVSEQVLCVRKYNRQDVLKLR